MEYPHDPSILLTPSTSVYKGRRDSIASAQSLYAQSYSSPFYSPKMPPTPTSERDLAADDFTFVHALPSFDGTSSKSVDDVFAECQSEVPVPLSQAMRGVDTHLAFSPDWVYVQQPNEYPVRQDRLRSTDALSAAGDLSSTFHALLSSPASLLPNVEALLSSSSLLHPSLAYPTSSTELSGVGAHDLGYTYASPPSLSHSGHILDWSSSTSGQSFSGLVAPETIQPKHSMFDMEDAAPYISSHSDSFDESSYDSCSSPPLHQQDAYPGMESGVDRKFKDEPETDAYEGRLYRSIYVSPTGGKGVKREQRNSGIMKKKSRLARNKSFVTKLRERDIQVEVDGDIGRDLNGRYYRVDGKGPKKFECQGFDDCNKKFARPEHLKRHMDTHSGKQDFPCMLPPSVQCHKRFNRRDNLLAHYATHVERSDGKTTRNRRFPFHELAAMIHKVTKEIGGPVDEGEKIVEWLEKKIKEGIKTPAPGSL